MKGWRWTLRPYARRLKRPVQIGDTSIEVRRGFFIEAVDPEGWTHRAECAPLPGLHHEKLDDAVLAWQRLGRTGLDCDGQLRGLDLDAPYWGLIAFDTTSSALQSSIEMLLLSYVLRQRSDLLPAAALSPCYELCALLQLPPASDAGWLAELDRLREKGVCAVKVKIGRQDPSLEMKLLEELRSALGDRMRLRLDANHMLASAELGKWQDFLRGWPLEYFEDPSLEGAASTAEWTLARDQRPGQGLPRDGSKVAVLKPNYIGLSRYLGFLRSASRRQQPLVLSNCYESALSLQLYAWLYSRYVAAPLALGFGTVWAFDGDDGVRGAGAWDVAARGEWPRHAFADFSQLVGSSTDAKGDRWHGS